jgi:hypothetical protein
VETSISGFLYVYIYMRIREIPFCVLASPDIWWRSCNVQPSDVTGHLVAVRGTPTLKCDIWLGWTDITAVYMYDIWEQLSSNKSIVTTLQKSTRRKVLESRPLAATSQTSPDI